MTDLPTKDTSLEHAPEVFTALAALAVIGLIWGALDLWHVLATAIAALCLYTRDTWTPQ